MSRLKQITDRVLPGSWIFPVDTGLAVNESMCHGYLSLWENRDKVSFSGKWNSEHYEAKCLVETPSEDEVVAAISEFIKACDLFLTAEDEL